MHHVKRFPIALSVALLLSLAVPALALADYGAIAVNPATGKAGVSYGQASRSAAETAALHSCKGSCKIVAVSIDQCAAVVKGKTTYYAGLGSSKSAAYAAARKKAKDTKAGAVAYECSG